MARSIMAEVPSEGRKEGYAVSDEQRSRRWLVKVKGCDQVSVLPSESLEIGRKPIRPLPDDGTPRFEIPDETRSMSKRHAVLRVLENGSATLRDMHSTNGTYLVHTDGRLVRLPEDIDFPMPSTAVRMQFGDVPIDFVQVDDSAEPEPEPAVTDLFAYATDDDKPAEPDAADMSVDDILDLRAGEPTSAFDANSVTRRANAMRHAALQSFTPMVAPVSDANRPEAIAKPVPLHVEPIKPEEPRDLFVDAMAKALDEPMPQTNAPENGPDIAPHADVLDHAAATADQPDESTRPVVQRMPVVTIAPTADDAESIAQTQPTAQSEPATQVDPVAQSAPNDTDPAANEPQTYTPAFEPGSVFDRVAKGEFRKPEPTVEVDGLTSDDAKHTTDYSVQFNMANHPELLPFLAMNPSLYYDLYRWLEARGDKDIDAALAGNPGYQEYRSSVGK